MQDAGRDDIELILPASTPVIRIARLLASGVAAQASLDEGLVTSWIRTARRVVT